MLDMKGLVVVALLTCVSGVQAQLNFTLCANATGFRSLDNSTCCAQRFSLSPSIILSIVCGLLCICAAGAALAALNSYIFPIRRNA